LELLIISNTDCSLTDVRVTSANALAVALLEHRDVSKFVFIDEASVYFDARTVSHEVGFSGRRWRSVSRSSTSTPPAPLVTPAKTYI
jgi:hypothetical protein